MAAKEALEKLYDSEKSGGLNWPAACDAHPSKVIATTAALQAALVMWREKTISEGTPPENCPVHVGWENTTEKTASHMIQLGEDLKAVGRAGDHILASLEVVLAIRRGVENGTDLETIEIAARQAIQSGAVVELEAPGKKVFKRKIGQFTEGPQGISQAKPFKALIDFYFPFPKVLMAWEWSPSPISIAIAIVVVIVLYRIGGYTGWQQEQTTVSELHESNEPEEHIPREGVAPNDVGSHLQPHVPG
ncbi:unnamed protein product [Trypanosoma congolense IL3000]|uniref:WGS project CAEQ00000000 data, annotated contig 998 n=1 Tax=Trypanosoma congolense (strain IL3000) TaxID=1068625 RepID=F9WK85_TRYCI|nr:unnamed protein product [Trypanosoma congolense IL3000]